MTVIYKKKNYKNNKSLNKNQNSSKNLIIPRIFHRIWLGNDPMPKEFIDYGKTWSMKHPNWETKLWTNENMIPLQNQDSYDKAVPEAKKSDIARLEILYKFGGVYIDCDFECLKNIEPLLNGIEAFSASEQQGIISNGIMGFVPGHQFLKVLIDNIPKSITDNKNMPINHQTGPQFITKVASNRDDIVIFPRKLFYPYSYDELYRKGQNFPDAFAVHHWSLSWL